MITQAASPRDRLHFAFFVVAATFVAMVVASGVRSSFSVFITPLTAEFHWDRSTIALGMSISVLINGLSQPLVGKLVDRYGPRWVITRSLMVAAAGVFLTSQLREVWQLYLGYGVVVSAAVSGPSSVVAAVVANRWFAANRGLVIGILMAGFSTGQLVLIPLAMQVNLALGWRAAWAALGIVACVVALPLAFAFLRDDPAHIGKKPYGVERVSAAAQAAADAAALRSTPLRTALRSRDFWLLAGGFGICGYTTLGLIGTHLLPFTHDHGIDPAAAGALGVMGMVNTAGTIAAGWLVDRYTKRHPLALVYFVRGLALVFLLAVDSAVGLFLFSVIFGMSYIASVPPTSQLTASIFGQKSMGTLFGLIFLSHQIGSAIGSYAGGLMYDLTGSYTSAILLGAALCFVAAAFSVSVEEPAPQRAALAPAD